MTIHYLYVEREGEELHARYCMKEDRVPEDSLMCVPVPNYAMTIKLKDYLNEFKDFIEDSLRFVKWNDPGDWKKLNECSWILERARRRRSQLSVGVGAPSSN